MKTCALYGSANSPITNLWAIGGRYVHCEDRAGRYKSRYSRLGGRSIIIVIVDRIRQDLGSDQRYSDCANRRPSLYKSALSLFPSTARVLESRRTHGHCTRVRREAEPQDLIQSRRSILSQRSRYRRVHLRSEHHSGSDDEHKTQDEGWDE